MGRIFSFSLTLIVISSLVVSCHSNRKILVENIDRVYIDYNPSAPNNIGVSFPGSICAQMKSGETVCFEKEKGLSFDHNTIDVDFKKEFLTVTAHPSSFHQSSYHINIVYTDTKGNSIESKDSVQLNFLASVEAFYQVPSGNCGTDGKDGKNPITFQAGNDGEHGMDGQNGSNAPNLDVHLWQRGDSLFAHVLNLSTHEVARYLALDSATISLYSKGADGGRGGNGGNGSNGRNGEINGTKQKYPGNGGRGGNSGNGGNGGNGGNVMVYLHSSVKNQDRLVIFNSGGSGGSAGDPGKGGKPGTPAGNQSAAYQGADGLKAQRGRDGNSGGQQRVIAVFEPSNYY